MTQTQIYLYGIVMLVQVFLVSYIMEIYKKTLRKNKSKPLENKLVGMVLSALSVVALVVTNMFKPILCELGAPIWVDYVAYGLGFYFAQLMLSMKVIKKMTASAIRNFLKEKGMNDKQIDELFNNVASK